MLRAAADSFEISLKKDMTPPTIPLLLTAACMLISILFLIRHTSQKHPQVWSGIATRILSFRGDVGQVTSYISMIRWMWFYLSRSQTSGEGTIRLKDKSGSEYVADSGWVDFPRRLQPTLQLLRTPFGTRKALSSSAQLVPPYALQIGQTLCSDNRFRICVRILSQWGETSI